MVDAPLFQGLAVSFADVEAAASRLAGVAHRTLTITSRTLNLQTGAEVFLKAENLQRSGAFKFRGAYNAVASIDPVERQKGVIGFSSGNHAQALALAAHLHGIPATIVMPEDAPESKRAATRGYGAAVVGYDRYTEDRAAIGARLAEERGGTLIPPYDHPAVIAGAGTAVLELMDDVPDLDLILVCTGGGGFLAGSAIAAKSRSPRVMLMGVEPAAGDDWKQSLDAGARIPLSDVPRTIADGQQTQAPGELTFPIVQALVHDIALVTDEEILDTMAFCFERLKLVIEPSGATALAALLSSKVEARGKKVGVTLSGGNISTERFIQLMTARSSS